MKKCDSPLKSRVLKDIAMAKKTIKTEVQDLKLLEKGLDESLTRALDLMQACKGRIILSGMGKSGIIAKKIVASLASTGSPSFFVHPAEASHGDLGMITKDDVVLAVSNSGESKELTDLLNYCKRFSIPLIAVTKNAKSTLGKIGDIVLKLPDGPEACPLGVAPTSSTTATLVLGDILTVALMQRKMFTKSDFNQRHPGGKLGSVLQRVQNLMHVGDEMPVLPQKSDMQKVIFTISSKRLGCVGLVDSKGLLTGIITDGDLRRCLSPKIFDKCAADLMTKKPYVISKDVLVSEAIKIMNDKKITNMFVLEKGKPVGVIHIHDLLAAGA